MRDRITSPNVGNVVMYVTENKPVYITGGKYYDYTWGQARVSNFWDWRYINKDGTLGKKGCGYGNFEDIPGVKVDTKVVVRFKHEQSKTRTKTKNRKLGRSRKKARQVSV